jgi:hypothetical protein
MAWHSLIRRYSTLEAGRSCGFAFAAHSPWPRQRDRQSVNDVPGVALIEEPGCGSAIVQMAVTV